MSAKSTRKAPGYSVESRTARDRPVFRPELQLCSYNTAEETYNLCEPGPKKEIPGYEDEVSSWAVFAIGSYAERPLHCTEYYLHVLPGTKWATILCWRSSYGSL